MHIASVLRVSVRHTDAISRACETVCVKKLKSVAHAVIPPNSRAADCRRRGGCFGPPKPTALLTHDHLSSRESESFGTRFRGAGATPTVAFGPRFDSLETESAAGAYRMAETLAEKAKNAKRPATDLSVPGVNWRAGRFRNRNFSSPTWTRTMNLAVNSRSLYRLSYRGVSGDWRLRTALSGALRHVEKAASTFSRLLAHNK